MDNIVANFIQNTKFFKYLNAQATSLNVSTPEKRKKEKENVAYH